MANFKIKNRDRDKAEQEAQRLSDEWLIKRDRQAYALLVNARPADFLEDDVQHAWWRKRKEWMAVYESPGKDA